MNTHGIGPEWTSGERVRSIRHGDFGTLADVRSDRILVHWDDGSFGAFSPEMARESFKPYPKEPE